MSLNKVTNIILEISAKTANKSSLTFAGLSVPQEMKVDASTPSYGNITIADKKIIYQNTTAASSISYTNQNTTNEVSTCTLTSTIPYNKLVTIGTVTITADSNYAITKKPVLVISSNNKKTKLFLQPTSVLNKFNINCITKESNVRGFKAELVYGISKTTAAKSIINKISIDSLVVEESGDARELKVYGGPNTPLKVFLLDSNDNSILIGANDKDAIIPGIRPCITSTLDAKGYFTFKPKLPKVKTHLSTLVNGDFSAGAEVIIFKGDVSSIEVGDQIISAASGPLKSVKVIETNVTGDPNTFKFSESLKLGNNSPVSFIKGNTYKMHITSTGAFNTSVNSSYPTITLNQALNPVLTISASDTNVNTVINGGVANTTNTQSFSGKPNRKPESYGGTKVYNISYTLTGRTFTLKPAGLVSTSFVNVSGDADFRFTKLQASGSGTTTFKLNAILIVDKWGVDPLTNITLNLNNIV